jgi:hypothetical protein
MPLPKSLSHGLFDVSLYIYSELTVWLSSILNLFNLIAFLFSCEI